MRRGSFDRVDPFAEIGRTQGPTVHLPTIHRPHVGHHSNDSYDEPVRDLGDDNWVEYEYLDRETVRLVERAYQDVLGRTLDASGRSTYARVVQERGWSESRLRKELRGSPGYRDIVVPRTIKTAYLEVLGREADSAGLRFYSSKMAKSGWNESRIRDALKKSPEYFNRTRIGVPRKEPTIKPPNVPQKSYSTPKPDRPKATSVATKPDRPKVNVAPVKPDRPKVTTTVKTPDRPKTNVVVSRPDRPKVTVSRPSPPPRKEKELPAKRPPPKLY